MLHGQEWKQCNGSWILYMYVGEEGDVTPHTIHTYMYLPLPTFSLTTVPTSRSHHL